MGLDFVVSGTAVPWAADSFDHDHPTTPRPNQSRVGGQAGAGDYSGAFGGNLVFRGRYLWRAGDFHFVFEPSAGVSLNITTAAGEGGTMNVQDILALAAGVDLIHIQRGTIDLHMLNVAAGFGWNMSTGDLTASEAVSPFGIEWHFLNDLSGMLTIPFTFTQDLGAGQTGVTFGPTFTFTYGDVAGDAPGEH
jgi:hypothetical protein